MLQKVSMQRTQHAQFSDFSLGVLKKNLTLTEEILDIPVNLQQGIIKDPC